ncbi:glycosyltransferase family 2 protein [Agrobacterium cavarae]
MTMLSICIPAYEMNGVGSKYLRESLSWLTRQKAKNFEVVVSDQARDNSISPVCAQFADSLTMRYVRGDEVARNASANVNNAIRHSRGDIVKILFQDDLLIDENAIDKIQSAFRSDTGSWLISGCMHTADGVVFKRRFEPRYHSGIYLGRNTISSPSVLALRKERIRFFDESLIWLMDVDYYKQCYDAFGDPLIINDPLIANRLHAAQVTNGVRKNVMLDEVRRVRAKYRSTESWALKICYWRELIRLMSTPEGD